MNKILPETNVIPNVFFLHGDVVELVILKDNRKLFSTELRVKDLLLEEDGLPNDERPRLYIEDEWATVCEKVWPTTRREYDGMTWRLTKLSTGQHTPLYKATQSRVV